MARDVEDVQVVSKTAGLNVTLTAFVAANGGEFENTNNRARIIVVNGDSSGKTVTISTDRTVTQQAAGIEDKEFSVSANSTWISPEYLNSDWAQASSSDIYVDIDDDTSVTWAVVEDAV